MVNKVFVSWRKNLLNRTSLPWITVFFKTSACGGVRLHGNGVKISGCDVVWERTINVTDEHSHFSVVRPVHAKITVYWTLTRGIFNYNRPFATPNSGDVGDNMIQIGFEYLIPIPTENCRAASYEKLELKYHPTLGNG
uniref:Arrestin-like N-terminal domain-containing protein n=1 Tax=Romanomermis culicivorax TaxID=13658 RepID=A0A915KRZ1_ROMCU